MTQEEKAKAYDEALERAKEMIKAMTNIGGVAKVDDIQYIFQLKESEGEKIIRKRIIGALHGDVLDIEETDKAIAWLEKQGEQKPAEYTLEQAAGIFLDALSNSPYNNKPITDAQVITKELLKFLADTNSYNPNAVNEPKPANWSEEDENLLGETIQCLEEFIRIAKYCGIDVQSYQRDVDWVKSLKDRVQPQQGWSKEDETYLKHIITAVKNCYKDDKGEENPFREPLLSWLKSLRPQSTWKPSDEQMKQLGWIAKQNKDNMIGKELMTLYQDLLKQREE